MSVYWNETGPDGYDYKVRECKNDGCSEVVYYDESSGRFAELNSGDVHDCPYYNKNNNSSQQQRPTQRPPQQRPQQQDNSSHIQQIEEYGLIQVEELKRQTDLLVTTKENTDLIAQYMRTIATIVKNIDEKLDSKLKESTLEKEDLEK